MTRPPYINKKAKAALQELRNLPPSGELRLVHEDNVTVELPRELYNYILELLGHLSRDNVIMITPAEAELTTTETARILGCSRMHVVKLIDEGKLRAHKIGTHRRIKVADLDEYRRRSNEERREALKEFMELSDDYFGDEEE